MDLGDDGLRDPGANLHERIRDTVKPILRQRVHRLLHGAELVGRVLVENRYAFVEVFGTGDKGVDLVKANPGVSVGSLSGFENEFFERTPWRRRLEWGKADANNGDPFRHDGPVLGYF